MRRQPVHKRHFEHLEPREVLSATVFEHDGIAYFLDQADPGFSRFDIAAEEWLAPIDLEGAAGLPTVAHGDDDGFYVAYGTSVYHYELDGTGQMPIISSQYAVQRLHTDGDLLFVNHSSGLYARVISVDKVSNSVIDTADYYVRSIHGSSIDTESNRIFGRSQGVSPSDISYVSYDDAGNFLGQVDSPYHGDYPGANQTWVFDDGSKVVDSSGTIYTTSLAYANSFQSGVTDIDFVGGEVPIVLSGSTLTSYTKGILPAGSVDVSGSPSDLFVNDESAIVFESLAGGWSETVVPLASLAAPEPGAAINPVGLPFTPDKIELASDGTVFLFSKQHSSVFRYDTNAQQWGQTIPLVGAPLYMAYSEVNQKLYLAYDTGLVRQIDLASETLEDTPFATFPQRPLGLATAGEYVFGADASGAWESHYTFAPDGTLISAVDWNYGANQYTWSPVNRKMYFFRDGTSPNDILWEDIGENGAIGTQRDSPLHSSAGFLYPIRISPDGGTAILGSGVIHDAITLARLPQALGNSVKDIAWLGSDAYTIRTIAGVAQLQVWAGTNWGLSNVAQLSGTAYSLTAVGEDRLLAITMDSNGVPQMTLIDGQLDVIPQPSPVAIAGDDVRVDIGFDTTLDGSESYDPDQSSEELFYSWRVASGPAGGEFGDAMSAVTSFSADAEGEYLVELTVSDGVYESTDTLLVTYRLNLPPVVDTTGSATTAILGRGAVGLTAAQSSDPNNDEVSFHWDVISAPEGAQWQLGLQDNVTTSLSADTLGEYEVQVVASDGTLMASDIVTVTFVANQTPTADTSLSVPSGVAGRHAATLDGRASTDPEGDNLSYLWQVVSGPDLTAVSLGSSTASVTSFNSNVAGIYEVRLTVDDGLDTDSTILEVTIAENQSPVADASRTETYIRFGEGSVLLDGTASSDPDDTYLQYNWRVVASSNDSVPVISYSRSGQAYLQPSEPGIYAVELAVSDGVSSDTDYVLITVAGNQAPTADASASDKVVVEGHWPQLDASLSFDPDGDYLTYQWSVVASSVGEFPEIADPESPSTRLLASDLGSYAVSLTISDGLATSTDFIIVTVRERYAHPWTGDFNGDGMVGLADYSYWRNNSGMAVEPYTNADATGDGMINRSDYLVWRAHFGMDTTEETSAVAAPLAASSPQALSSTVEQEESAEESTEAVDSAVEGLYTDPARPSVSKMSRGGHRSVVQKVFSQRGETPNANRFGDGSMMEDWSSRRANAQEHRAARAVRGSESQCLAEDADDDLIEQLAVALAADADFSGVE